MERISYFPEMTFAEQREESADLWDYCMVSIEGFVDQKTKKEIKCTKANKVALMKNPVFDRFVARCFQIMSESSVKMQEAEKKT